LTLACIRVSVAQRDRDVHDNINNENLVI
jgi:hypothetical protein